MFWLFPSQSIPYFPINGDYKSTNNYGINENRTGRESYDVLKCCENIQTPIESNSPLNRNISRYRDDESIDCQFSSSGCNFRTTDFKLLNVHNEENSNVRCISSHYTFNFSYY